MKLRTYICLQNIKLTMISSANTLYKIKTKQIDRDTWKQKKMNLIHKEMFPFKINEKMNKKYISTWIVDLLTSEYYERLSQLHHNKANTIKQILVLKLVSGSTSM